MPYDTDEAPSVVEDDRPRASPGRTRRPRRGLLVGGVLGLVAVIAVAVTVTVQRTSSQAPASTTRVSGVDPIATGPQPWLSGASGDGVADGTLGPWRGRPLDVAGTWADNDTAMVALPQLHEGGEFGAWTGSMDIAIGAIGNGETWKAAARGDYDDRWRQSLTNLRDLWGSRSGTLFIRFAHEMNGNWYPWSVDAGNYRDFMTGWKRFRALQQEIFPASKLVFCLNRESVGNGIDWRKTFPGAQYVDVLGVDYYNGDEVADAAGFTSSAQRIDQYGAPVGILGYQEFARSVGLPLAVPEWSGNADHGDSVAFMTGMHDFFRSQAGTGAGQLWYEVLFNVQGYDGKYLLFGDTRLPQSARAYQRLW